MAARYPNGRIPASELVRLDTGAGRHVATAVVALLWYLIRRDVYRETGVTLYISPGMNAYRDYAEQIVGKASACAQGNCAAAASAGSSSHGGSCAYSFTGYRLVDAMALDIGNYWAVPWDVFKRVCEKYGFRVGLITKEIAGIHEPWHVINFAPYQNVAEIEAAYGVRLTRGADGVYRLTEQEDDMTPIEMLEAKFAVQQGSESRQVSVAEAFRAVYFYGDLLHSVVQNIPADVWAHRLTHPLNTEGIALPAGDFLRYEPAEHENTRRAVGALGAAVAPDIDYDRVAAEIAEKFPQLDAHAFAVAAADEADRRERERLAQG